MRAVQAAAHPEGHRHVLVVVGPRPVVLLARAAEAAQARLQFVAGRCAPGLQPIGATGIAPRALHLGGVGFQILFKLGLQPLALCAAGRVEQRDIGLEVVERDLLDMGLEQVLRAVPEGLVVHGRHRKAVHPGDKLGVVAADLV